MHCILSRFRPLFNFLTDMGYCVELQSAALTEFSADSFAILMIIDPEGEFSASEMAKLWDDVHERGLSLLIVADWYDEKLLQSLQYVDDNTHSIWSPITGGSNIPALNRLLSEFGAELSYLSYEGKFKFADKQAREI